MMKHAVRSFVLAMLVTLVSAAVSLLGAQQSNPKINKTELGVVIDVQDADLRTVIAALAEAASLNVVYNELPAKSVTVRLHDPIPPAEVKAFLKSLVETNGLEFHDEGSIIRLSPPAPRPVAVNPAPAGGSQSQLFVYRLKHAPAVRLAGTLQSLFGIGGTGPGISGSGNGMSSLSQELQRQQVPPGIPTTPSSNVAPAAVAVIGGKVQGEIQIVPDELTNSLLVRATPADWTIISSAIEALDLRPLQVVVEVLIAEVRRSSLLDLGLSISTPLQHDRRTGADVGGELKGSTAGDLVVKILSLGRVQADVLISSLYSRSDVTILSRPVILAQNNQDARIMIGSERPFVQVFRALPTDAAVRDQVVQYRDVGTSLKIRPTINYDGYVSLDLLQEVSTATNEVQFGAPVISTREASTRLLVKNHQTAVIGGLIDRQQDHTRGGIPVLRDIPLLGRLFGSSQDNKIQTELFLFITPHIVATDADVDSVKDQIEHNTELLRKQIQKNQPIIRADTTANDRKQ